MIASFPGRTFLLVLLVVLFVSIPGCRQPGDEPVQVVQTPAETVLAPPLPHGEAADGSRVEEVEEPDKTAGMPAVRPHEVVVPESVKGRWKAVSLEVRNTKTDEVTSIEAPLGQRVELPGTTLTIEAVAFLPSFFMGDGKITSINNETNNPAAQIVVRNGDTQIYTGWLFARFPAVHPFEHPDVSVVLVGQVPAAP